MNPYPEASKVADDSLKDTINTLQRFMEQSTGRIETRIGEMATKDAVEAHVARLDQRDDHLETRMVSGFDKVTSEMASGFASVATRDAERDNAQEKREIARDTAAKERDELRDKKFSQRMTWTLTIVGIAFTAFQVFIAPLLQT